MNITHEDLSPMYYTATIRGRLEEDEERHPVLILKAPHGVHDYFEFKEVPEDARNSEKHVQMVRDEYIRVARTLIETGLPASTDLLLADAHRYFPDREELLGNGPFPLKLSQLFCLLFSIAGKTYDHFRGQHAHFLRR